MAKQIAAMFIQDSVTVLKAMGVLLPVGYGILLAWSWRRWQSGQKAVR